VGGREFGLSDNQTYVVIGPRGSRFPGPLVRELLATAQRIATSNMRGSRRIQRVWVQLQSEQIIADDRPADLQPKSWIAPS
jgi:hypothetical protein